MTMLNNPPNGQIPDYTAGITQSASFTATFAGLAVIKSHASDTAVLHIVKINDVTVISVLAAAAYENEDLIFTLPIRKGDVVSVTGPGAITIVLYPFK